MTTAELIEKLRAYVSETRVVVQGYEGGYDDIARIRPVSIKLNANPEWYYGKRSLAPVRKKPIGFHSEGRTLYNE